MSTYMYKPVYYLQQDNTQTKWQEASIYSDVFYPSSQDNIPLKTRQPLYCQDIRRARSRCGLPASLSLQQVGGDQTLVAQGGFLPTAEA